MHALLIVLIVLLSLIAVVLGIIAFVLFSVYFTIQPILGQLGKISMIIEAARFVQRRFRKRRQHQSAAEDEGNKFGRDRDRDDTIR